MRVNYTTYDMRRAQDYINPRTQRDIMLLSQDSSLDAHPFWYARVLGIFHVEVGRITNDGQGDIKSKRKEVLWVRWFGIEPGHRSGLKAARLPKIGFVPEQDQHAFGFLDPSLVLRACHLPPVFSGGRTNSLLSYEGLTVARPLSEKDDWENYYVNM